MKHPIKGNDDTMVSPSPVKLENYKEKLVAIKAADILDIPAFISAFTVISAAVMDDGSSEKLSVLKVDTMTIWLTRGLQLLKINGEFVAGFCLSHSITQLMHLFNYVCQVYESGNGPFTNAASSLLTKLLQFISKVRSAKKDALSLSQLTERIMAIPLTQKSFFNISEVFLKEVDDAVLALYDQEGSFPKKCLEMIWSSALVNSVSRAFASFFTHLHDPNGDMQQYIRAWSPLIEKSLKVERERVNVINHILPKLFRPCPTEFIGWIQSLNIKKSSDEWRILMLPLLTCAYSISSANDPIASNALTEPELSSLLKHADERCRRDSFLLVCSSVSGTREPPEYALNIILNCFILGIFFKESTTPESRNDFSSLMRKCFLSCRDFIIFQEKLLQKTKDEKLDFTIRNLKRKLRSIFQFIASQMTPDSSYPQLALSTEFLKFFVEYEFDGVQRGIKKDVKKRLNIFEIFSKELTGTLFRFVSNNYDDIRKQCSYILNHCPIETFELIYYREMMINTINLLSSLKGRQSDGGAQVIKTAAQIYMRSDNESQVLECLNMVLSSMNSEIEAGLSVHGHFTAMSEILTLVSPKFYESHASKLSPIIISLLHTSLGMWQVLKPQMTLAATDVEEESDSKAWRTVKENSHLLKTLMNLNAINKWKIFDQNAFLKICDLLMDQLGNLSHRGAFSAIYPAFVQACELCYDTDLENLPLQWLQTNLKLLETKEQLITRRSAGIPFLLTAILNSCDTNHARLETFVELTFLELFRIAQIEYNSVEDEKHDLPQVHAFNCMKYIFRESSLSTAVSAYLEKALEISLTNLNHTVWAIKNGAVMLFTTLQEKLLGSQKLGSLESGKSASLFFSKFSGIKGLLLSKLRESKNVNDVFLVLSILLRLQAFSENDGTLDKFVDIITEKFLGHSVWKIREMAAKLICMMTHTHNSSLVLKKLEILEGLSRNEIHGRLLCLLELLKSARATDSDLNQCIQSAETCFQNPAMKGDWINLRAALLILATKDFSARCAEVSKSYVHEILTEKKLSLDGQKRLFLEPAIISILTSCTDPQEIFRLTKQYSAARYYEAQIAVVEYWKNKPKQFENALEVQNILVDLVNDDCTWNYVKTACMHLLVISGVQGLRPLTPMRKWTDSMRSLHVVLEARLAQPDGSRILNLLTEFAADELPEESRLHSVMACKSLLSTNSVNSSSTTRLWFLLFEKLSDDSLEVRSLASIDNMCAEASKHTILDRLVLDYRDESFDLFLSYLESSVNLNLKSFELEQNSTFFEIERPNLFRNEVEIHENLTKKIVEISAEAETSKFRIQSAISRNVLSVWNSVKANEDLIASWTFSAHLDTAIRKVLQYESICSNQDQILINDLKGFLYQNQYFI